jgi:hypothetical protein
LYQDASTHFVRHRLDFFPIALPPGTVLESPYALLNREIDMLLADSLNETAALEHISHRCPYICKQQFDTLRFQLGLQVGQHLNAVNVKLSMSSRALASRSMSTALGEGSIVLSRLRTRLWNVVLLA